MAIENKMNKKQTLVVEQCADILDKMKSMSIEEKVASIPELKTAFGRFRNKTHEKIKEARELCEELAASQKANKPEQKKAPYAIKADIAKNFKALPHFIEEGDGVAQLARQIGVDEDEIREIEAEMDEKVRAAEEEFDDEA